MFPKIYRCKQPSAPWLVVFTDPTQRSPDGKPRRYRFRFKKEADAIAKHKALTADAHLGGVVGLTFDPRAKAEWQAARSALDTGGHLGISLIEVARQWMRGRAGPAHSEWEIEPLYREFIAAKEGDNARLRTVANLKVRVWRWILDQKLARVGDINEATLRALKERKLVSPQTRVNDMAAVSSFLSYLADDRKILPVNPLLAIARPRLDPRTPRVLTVDQAKALLESARRLEGGRLLRYFVLCLLAGLRPAEASETAPENVVLSREGFVRVMISKRRGHRRQVPVSTAFRAWWKVAPQTPFPLFEQVRDRPLFDSIRADAGLIGKGEGMSRRKMVWRLWQGDICRHTWISLRLAETRDEALVALEAGTSIAMIHKHYLEWITAKDARAMAALRPSVLAPGSAANPAPPAG